MGPERSGEGPERSGESPERSGEGPERSGFYQQAFKLIKSGLKTNPEYASRRLGISNDVLRKLKNIIV